MIMDVYHFMQWNIASCAIMPTSESVAYQNQKNIFEAADMDMIELYNDIDEENGD